MAERKILIVEDEYFLADDCAQLVKAAGCQVVGPFNSMSDALRELPHDVHGAVLDINLHGSHAYPLLDRLLIRDIPIVIWTGYDRHYLPSKYAHLTFVAKPDNCAAAVKGLALGKRPEICVVSDEPAIEHCR